MSKPTTASRKRLERQGQRPCPQCKGTGQYAPYYATAPGICQHCSGHGMVPPVNADRIRADVQGRTGPLRASAPCKGQKQTLDQCRAYYVWRLARFHGGADTTMPIVAGLFAGNDPFKADLDTLADTLAREAFGTDMAALRTWGRSLGLR